MISRLRVAVITGSLIAGMILYGCSGGGGGGPTSTMPPGDDGSASGGSTSDGAGGGATGGGTPEDGGASDDNDTSVDSVDGGTSGGDSAMSLLNKWQRFEAGNPTLEMTSAQIAEAYDSRSRRASHDLIAVLGAVAAEPVSPPAEPSTSSDEQWSINAEADPYEHEDLPPGLVAAPVLEHDGVRIAELKGRTVDDQAEAEAEDYVAYLYDFVVYAGWLDHTDFGVGFYRGCPLDVPGCSGTSPDYGFAVTEGVTPHGVYPGTTPTGTGSATWTGVMIGMESLEFYADGQATVPAWVNEGPDVYLGDAQIRIDDLATPDIDVSFTNIHNVTAEAKHPDMHWEGLAVEDGLFGSGDYGEFITGMFTGPRHQEVGGQFERDGIVGGFGAKRR